ncbi:MAG: hypothetical protein H6685_06865 [Deltaproteobacteria bacterium]|nr:hypothetical protein [Deltaproteobacteria bacterium]
MAGFAAAIFCATLLAGCTKSPDNVVLPPPDVPVFPHQRLLAREFGNEHYKLTYQARTHPDTVADFYARNVPKNGWRVETTSSDEEGSQIQYYSKEGRVLFVMIAAESDDDLGCRFVVAEAPQGVNIRPKDVQGDLKNPGGPPNPGAPPPPPPSSAPPPSGPYKPVPGATPPPYHGDGPPPGPGETPPPLAGESDSATGP